MIDTGIKVAFNARRAKHALRIYLLLVSHWRLWKGTVQLVLKIHFYFVLTKTKSKHCMKAV